MMALPRSAQTAVIEKVVPPSLSGNLVPCHSKSIAADVLSVDEKQVIKNFKIGLLYCRPGQTTEEDMLRNAGDGSPAYQACLRARARGHWRGAANQSAVPCPRRAQSFLRWIGETIRLRGWPNYRGGLDVRDDQTGTHSVFSQWRDYSIMFHVATMLPNRVRRRPSRPTRG